MEEGTTYDKKSLLSFNAEPAQWDWDKIAKHCVAFANARGGELFFGIEDDASAPPPGQQIPDSLGEPLQKGIGHHCINVAVSTEKRSFDNGGEVLVLRVFPSRQSVAATTNGRYFMRVSDESRPVMPDELVRLAAEKDAYIWELQTTLRLNYRDANSAKRFRLLQDLRASNRVSTFILEKDDIELFQHFSLLSDDEKLTNLGVLWIGEQSDRKRLRYPPAIQFIKYDEQEKKVKKLAWTDSTLNPKELIESVWSEIPDWKEYTEIPDGMFRDTVPHYDEVVVRELLANAIIHRPYTTRGDIFINLYPDRLEFHNPGLLPLGVTPQNILHQRVPRNPHLAELAYALGLMEKEGSGYDAIYDVLLSQGRQVPTVLEEHDRVVVTIERRIIKAEVIDFVARIDELYQLTQRERISLGMLAQHGSLTALEFSRLLAVDEGMRLRGWVGRLIEEEIVLTRGRTRATEYRVNPRILKAQDFKGPTTLKVIAPHRLRELALEDVSTHGPNAAHPTTFGAIHDRIGKEISASKLRSALNTLITDGRIKNTGKRGRGGGYYLCESAPNK
jgi:ATP-dependent DNA helicase RecG